MHLVGSRRPELLEAHVAGGRVRHTRDGDGLGPQEVAFQRDGERIRLEPDTFTVTLKRDFLRPQSVSIARMADSATGYVRLEEFGPTAADEVHRALKDLKGKGMRRLILDLRANPGGYVIAAVELASEFLPKGTVVFRTRGRKKDVDTTYTTKRNGDFRDLPMVVLIDEYSASAAEALSASLQDHDRALILGRRSFGKALMQADFLVLPNGDDLHLTIGYVLSPSGRFIQRRYRGLAVEQYTTLAGKGGAAEDTLRLFRTDSGRPVRGGGGVAPDVTLAPPPALPVWWSVAAGSGFDFAVADSVALALPATPAGRDAWMTSPQQWRVRLASPFLDRVRAR